VEARAGTLDSNQRLGQGMDTLADSRESSVAGDGFAAIRNPRAEAWWIISAIVRSSPALSIPMRHATESAIRQIQTLRQAQLDLRRHCIHPGAPG
jgi:hypothetical protein